MTRTPQRKTLGDFTIDAATGVITVSNAPTFSLTATEENTRTLTVRATDTSTGAAGETTTEETITIEVTAPLTIALQTSAAGGATTITIDESDDTAIAITELSLATAGVTLADTNPYVIQGAAPAGVAATIADDGAITARVDYEALTADHQMNGIPVIVEVTGSESGQSGTINLIIMVTNLDDENPEIGAIPIGITVEAETTTLSVDPLTITATDDLGAGISYAFVDDSDAPAQTLGDFTIDAATGVITVSTAPTFSLTATENTRTLTVRATDTSTGATGQTAEADITIEILPPSTIELQTSAADGATSFTIDESDDSSVDVTTISITTPGVTPAAADPYTLAAGAPAGFAITDAGVLTAQLDYEMLPPDQQTNGITITVQATGSVAGQNGNIVLTITVTNLDDEAPVFDAIPTGVTVEAGTQTLSAPIDIDATDSADGALGNDAEITYAFVDDLDAPAQTLGDFTIDAATGVITVATEPTFSATADDNERTLTIRATDTSDDAEGDTTTEETITIEVTAPLTIDLESTEGVVIAIDEDDTAPVDVTTISATTAGVTLTANPYALAAGSPAGFAINTGGMLAAQLDYDTLTPNQQTNGITITVQATGSVAGQNGSINLTITVTNIDDEAPVFDAIPTGVTVESGTQTLSAPIDIDATDSADGALGNDAEITYAFVDDSDAPAQTLGDFTIDAATGVITVSNAPTFSMTATENTRTLTVRATDTSPGASGEQFVERDIVIEVVLTIDSDNDGLIDINTLEELNNIRKQSGGN